jgi:hypothetical protein
MVDHPLLAAGNVLSLEQSQSQLLAQLRRTAATLATYALEMAKPASMTDVGALQP